MIIDMQLTRSQVAAQPITQDYATICNYKFDSVRGKCCLDQKTLPTDVQNIREQNLWNDTKKRTKKVKHQFQILTDFQVGLKEPHPNVLLHILQHRKKDRNRR